MQCEYDGLSINLERHHYCFSAQHPCWFAWWPALDARQDWIAKVSCNFKGRDEYFRKIAIQLYKNAHLSVGFNALRRESSRGGGLLRSVYGSSCSSRNGAHPLYTTMDSCRSSTLAPPPTTPMSTCAYKDCDPVVYCIHQPESHLEELSRNGL